MQRDMLNRTYFIEIVEGTSRGLGISNAKPEYGTAQPEAVSEALEEAPDLDLVKSGDADESNWPTSRVVQDHTGGGSMPQKVS